jgi:hypothetical protein
MKVCVYLAVWRAMTVLSPSHVHMMAKSCSVPDSPLYLLYPCPPAL